jgi:hypothetical protein
MTTTLTTDAGIDSSVRLSGFVQNVIDAGLRGDIVSRDGPEPQQQNTETAFDLQLASLREHLVSVPNSQWVLAVARVRDSIKDKPEDQRR